MMGTWWGVLLVVLAVWLGASAVAAAVIAAWGWPRYEPEPEPDDEWSRPHGNVTVIRSRDPYDYPPRGGR
jgi:hypothetical protein